MTRYQIAVILDAHLALEDGGGQVAQLGEYAADDADEQAVQPQAFREENAEEQGYHGRADDPADSALTGFLGTDGRTEFFVAENVVFPEIRLWMLNRYSRLASTLRNSQNR